MTKRVYVIASFNTDGDTQPLWLKLSLDKDAPCYKIENYICTKKTGQIPRICPIPLYCIM